MPKPPLLAVVLPPAGALLAATPKVKLAAGVGYPPKLPAPNPALAVACASPNMGPEELTETGIGDPKLAGANDVPAVACIPPKVKL